MLSRARHLLNHILPSHFHDPVGVVRRILQSDDPAAHFALFSSGLGLAAMPLDFLLYATEQRFVRQAHNAKLPLIFVCGPPRSGTTLVYQTLVQHLPLAYFSNITSLFPRSPLTATRLAQRFLKPSRRSYQSFYGKTAGFAGPNDALYLWDRWLGPDRSRSPDRLSQAQRLDIQRFFSASEALYDLPLVNKNNNLNVSAHLVAECLENAIFICLNRSQNQLAQSLYRARHDIHGSADIPYGLVDQNSGENPKKTPVRSVCDQVLFFGRVARQQELRLGRHRFWNVCYETFCQNPRSLLERVAKEILHAPGAIRGAVPTYYTISRRQRVSDAIRDDILRTFDELNEENNRHLSHETLVMD